MDSRLEPEYVPRVPLPVHTHSGAGARCDARRHRRAESWARQMPEVACTFCRVLAQPSVRRTRCSWPCPQSWKQWACQTACAAAVRMQWTPPLRHGRACSLSWLAGQGCRRLADGLARRRVTPSWARAEPVACPRMTATLAQLRSWPVCCVAAGLACHKALRAGLSTAAIAIAIAIAIADGFTRRLRAGSRALASVGTFALDSKVSRIAYSDSGASALPCLDDFFFNYF